jgi:uncharacterized protein (DUF1499 family)
MTPLQTFLIRFTIGIGIFVFASVVLLAILGRVVKSPANLGVKEGRLAPCPNSPNCVSSQSQDPRHKIEPIAYSTTLQEAKAALLQAIGSTKGTVVVADDPTYVRVEFHLGGLFGYVDDVEFTFDQEAQVIHFRSSSRLPYYDWNVNRNRMEAIRAAFEATGS